jgi:hypothetical protein
MGCSCMGSSSGNCSPSYTKKSETTPNPNPHRFTIKEIWSSGHASILWVNYPDCTTFNGDKIMVYCGLYWDRLLEKKALDPHFIIDDMNYPLVRFRGNHHGLEWAKSFVESALLTSGQELKKVYEYKSEGEDE